MKRKVNTNISLQKKMMMLLTKAGLQGRRHAICWQFSNEQTESSKELTEAEVEAICTYLETEFSLADEKDQMRKKMISLARQMNWEKRDGNKTKCDMARLDNWCIKYGMYKKALNSHDYTELTHLITAFKKAHKHFFSAV